MVGHSILLVDDEEGIRKTLTLVLLDMGYEVLSAATGEDALTQFRERRPHVVVTDIRMPGMDGIEVLRGVKSISPETEVIMITGHGDMDVAIHSLKNGASDFLTKPVNLDLLENALRSACEKITLRAELKAHTENLEAKVREQAARLIEMERQVAAFQVVEGFSSAVRGLVSELDGETYFNELPCFVSIHNRYLEVVAANQLYRERLGDKVGRSSWEIYKERDGGREGCPVDKTIWTGKGQRSKETVVDLAGAEIPVIVHTAPISRKDDKVDLVLEISVDVTEVKRLQDELSAVQRKYRNLFDSVPCAIMVMDRDMRVVEANARFKLDFGGSVGALCHEAYRRKVEPCERCPAFQTLEDGLVHELETVVEDRAGQRRNVLVSTTPVRGPSGEIERIMELSADITQIRRLQSHLTSLGLLIGSISHGLKGILAAIDGGIYHLDKVFQRPEMGPERSSWSMLKDMIERIRGMVLDVLYYAKERELHRVRKDVRVFAGEIAQIMGLKASRTGITFVADIGPDIGELEIDPIVLGPALVNILENAIEACAEDRTKDKHTVGFTVREDADQICFEISDNGMGMDGETKAKMFTLFFSNKGSKGTGLGLFIANQVVEQHGGRIEVESEPGLGSRFLVHLPRGPAATPMPATSPGKVAQACSAERRG
ncbi:PAS domain S-box [Desulfocurvibacter africanus PCS]|uniref:histidine kinase n=1 Tax=Desulfocurvibacter africanus PCS TaxID=1262666 RepID=M5PSF9_DESAF|nr:response regulator [Desulfocurvibacter africanus]EMG37312.1 PAS domain S-box [Desulfocurvibacter africanus PCS]